MNSIASKRTIKKDSLFSDATNVGTLPDWVEQLTVDPIVANIIESEAFARLKRISFLGALDYIAPTFGLTKGPRTRADHSLHVAALAKFVAYKRGYNIELSRHLVVAGLLHDIGHPPLSHSVEPYLKKRFGYGHHEMGEMLLAGKHKAALGLSKILKGSLDTAFIRDLIAGKAKELDGGDLFSSPINIDTIEGIIRSYRYLADTPTSLDPLSVARASFLDQEEERYKLLDKFWELKGFIYNNLITRDIGLIADQYSQSYFAEPGHQLGESELFDNEFQWRKKHHKLFQNLSGIQTVNDAPAALKKATLEYSLRRYEISPAQQGVRRYQCVKRKAKYTLDTLPGYGNKPATQLMLSLAD